MRVLSSLISGLFHISAYSGKSNLDKDIIKSQKILIKEQKRRHNLINKFTLLGAKE